MSWPAALLIFYGSATTYLLARYAITWSRRTPRPGH
jgi:hypothetical protein